MIEVMLRSALFFSRWLEEKRMNRAEKPVLIIQMGQPPAPIAADVGQQSDWFRSALAQLELGELLIVRPDLNEALPPPSSLTAAIVTGSWAMVTDRLAWSERTGVWLRQAVDEQLPLLGVCYGHQLLADALGGTVTNNPQGKEVGLKTVSLAPLASQDTLLSELPTYFSAYLTHLQSVVTPPPGAQVLASSALDGCQILRYSPTALSFQFHPEMDADVMNACLKNNRQPTLTVQEEPRWARRLLVEFVRQARLARPAAARAGSE